MGVKPPKDFYKSVTERHEKKESIDAEKEIHYELPDTERLYYDGVTKFSAKVLDISDNIAILDKTAFYPESGGQEGDRGFLNDCPVSYTKVSGNVILHIMEKINFKKGDTVKGVVDEERRLNLTRHHTATHIINGVSRQILGNHIWQAGAEKTEEKARLDITHYKLIDSDDLFKIERISNEIVLKNLTIEKGFFPRAEAEKNYGFRLYQGGAVPGKKLRVVNVKGLDVEACGGTHADYTGQIGPIKILKQSKIQDGVVRLEFCAGVKALEAIQEESILLRDLSDVFKVEKDKLLDTGKRFFNEWKSRGKEIEKLKAEMSCLKKEGLECNFIESDGVLFMEENVDTSPDEMRKIARELSGDNKVIVLTNNEGNVVVSCGKIAIENGHKACELIKKYGKGGGKDDFAQGVKG
jgi:alanyl-tRNA synthetase